MLLLGRRTQQHAVGCLVSDTSCSRKTTIQRGECCRGFYFESKEDDDKACLLQRNSKRESKYEYSCKTKMCTMTKADSSISCHAQAMTKRGENARPRFSKQAWSFDFGEAGRMIGERRNAVCEIRPPRPT